MEIKLSTLSINEKLQILADAAKYDVACTSSGSDRRGQKGMLGNSVSCGICHSFAGDGRCISLLKILQSNDCIYNCRYCLNRADNDCIRATFQPEEICELVTGFYKRNYIEGLFLSSGVVKNPVYTAELMYKTLYLLRTKYRFNGYIHVKAIPYAPEEVLEQMGYLADRMSINLELPTADGLADLAPQKTRSSILLPMRQVQNRIMGYRLAIGKSTSMERSLGNRLLENSIFSSENRSGIGTSTPQNTNYSSPSHQIIQKSLPGSPEAFRNSDTNISDLPIGKLHTEKQTHSLHSPVSPHPVFGTSDPRKPFVPAGQSTQMIIGATGESDYEILLTTQALYQQFDLKRVFYSAYVPLNEDHHLPAIGTPPPLLREHRLYQADWLLRYYGFHAEELLTPQRPDFNLSMDPKCDWALRHLEQFPVEISTADYSTLMRIPGIGNKSAMRILQSRKTGSLSYESIKKMGVVLKRAQYFITCNGKMYHRIPMEEGFITRQLTGMDEAKSWEIQHPRNYRQLSLFDFPGLTSESPVNWVV